VDQMSYVPGFSNLDRSLFGGVRAHADLAVFERLHDYPGVATAYEPEHYGYLAVGTGVITHLVNEGALRQTITVGTAGDRSILRSHDIVRYQPGCMPVVQLTGCTSTAFTTLTVKRRSSTSGVVVDYELAIIPGYSSAFYNRYEVRYAYLGVQAAEFFINGTSVHFANFAGTLTQPYMKTPHLPLSVEFVNTAADTRVWRIGVFDDSDGLFFEWSVTSAASLYVDYKCASARLVGGSEYPYWSYGASFNKTGVGNTLTPVFSVRVKALLNGINSRAQVFPRLLTFFSETQAGACHLILNPTTLPSATWVAASPSSAVEIDTAATTYTGGTTIWQVSHGANYSSTYALDRLFTIIGRKLRRQALTGTSDILTFAAVREGTVNFDPRITIVFDELR
jgi:hypothetical protein